MDSIAKYFTICQRCVTVKLNACFCSFQVYHRINVIPLLNVIECLSLQAFNFVHILFNSSLFVHALLTATESPSVSHLIFHCCPCIRRESSNMDSLNLWGWYSHLAPWLHQCWTDSIQGATKPGLPLAELQYTECKLQILSTSSLGKPGSYLEPVSCFTGFRYKDLLDEGADFDLLVWVQECVREQLRVGGTILHLLVQADWDEVIEGVRELSRSKTWSGIHQNLHIQWWV